MIEILATNIVSPLGVTTEENYQAIKANRSALMHYVDWRGIPHAFTASIFSAEQAANLRIEGFSHFESSVIRSIREALLNCDVDITSPRTLLILSTTKGNIDELDIDDANLGGYLSPGATAQKVASHFGMKSQPIVVCNACISGVTAQILADRLLSADKYDVAVVCGADAVSPFVVSGFLSFKSLSPKECRPFDIERLGLNLGDGAATIVFGKASANSTTQRWRVVRGQLSNDAYHISSPSPQGEGTVQAIKRVLDGVQKEEIGAVCVHGTATLFNDHMESMAIERTGLSDIPVTAFKGFYGHTLGAAGVLETILVTRALDDGLILPVRGYNEIGVGGKINISNQLRTCDKQSFLKIISGFGGCNGVLLYAKGTDVSAQVNDTKMIECTHTVRITPDSITLDGTTLDTTSTGKAMLKEVYKSHVGDCTKFVKMDALSRLAVLGTNLMLQQERCDEQAKRYDIILFNGSSSIVGDCNHLAMIRNRDNFYPSPSIFLHTMPNIATGEIAIQHAFRGETSLYILEKKSEDIMNDIATISLQASDNDALITGWVDCSGEDIFEAEIKILTKK